MLPETTDSPPNTLMPRCCPGESPPLREEPCPFLCAMVATPSGGNAGDLDLGVRLAMAADAVPALFLRAEVPQLAVLAVRDHLGLHFGAGDEGRTHLHVTALADEQHIEVQLRADRLLELLHLEKVAFFDAVLLSTSHDDCVHLVLRRLSALIPARLAGRSRRRARKGTGDLAVCPPRCQGTRRTLGTDMPGRLG